MATKRSTTKAAVSAAKKPPTKLTVAAASAKPKSASAAPPADAKLAAKAAVKPPAPATFTLKHLSSALTERHGMPKKQADTVLTDVFEAIVTHLVSGARVWIGGLGIIEVKDRPARAGRNPATGEAIQIAASKKVAFRAAKELKDAI